MLSASDSPGYVWFNFLSVTFTNREWLRVNIQGYFPLKKIKNNKKKFKIVSNCIGLDMKCSPPL